MSDLWWLTQEGKQQLDAENRALDERAAYEYAEREREAYEAEHEQQIRQAQHEETWAMAMEAAAKKAKVVASEYTRCEAYIMGEAIRAISCPPLQTTNEKQKA